MYKYEMDPTKTVGATEQTWDAGLTEGRTDRRTDRWIETNIPPQQLHCAEGMIMLPCFYSTILIVTEGVWQTKAGMYSSCNGISQH